MSYSNVISFIMLFFYFISIQYVYVLINFLYTLQSIAM